MCPKVGSAFSNIHISRMFFFFVQWFEVWVTCSYCWCVCNCWPSLWKPPVHDTISVTHYPNTPSDMISVHKQTLVKSFIEYLTRFFPYRLCIILDIMSQRVHQGRWPRKTAVIQNILMIFIMTANTRKDYNVPHIK